MPRNVGPRHLLSQQVVRLFAPLVCLMLAASTGYAQTRPSANRSLLERISARNSNSLRVGFNYSPRFPQVGQVIQFTDTSSGNPVSWLWDFGDGTTSTGKNPTHVYTGSGFRKVTLAAANGSVSKKAMRTLAVMPPVSVATFVFSPATPGPGQTVQFADTTPGGPTFWHWDFGDGTTSSVKNPNHAFGRAGSYIVNLTASNVAGSKQGAKTITVASISTLSSSFTFSPASPITGQAVQFTDTSVGSPTAWLWNFGDGSTSTARNPSHAYTTAGPKTVTLTVTNNSGSDSSGRTVTVGAALMASFSYTPANPAAGQTVQFTDTSTGSPTAWSWNFGDGSTSTARNPSHAYTTAGPKTVILTVTNSSGSDGTSRTVTVGAAPVASFIYTPANPAAGQTVQFTDTSTGSPTAWSWNFGDGSASTTRNPSHVYTAAGSFQVTLLVTNSSGSNSASMVVSVNSSATLLASFAFDPASPSIGQPVRFTDTSTGNPTSWQWSFGDGATSTAQNPNHAFSATGAYTVTLIVGNGERTSSYIRTITVGSPSALIPPDRRVDWSYAGIPGGIPARTAIATTVYPGATAAQISAAIAAASGSGGVVYLSAGTYNLSSGITFGAANNVTLRGAGPGQTTLVLTGSGSYIQPGGDYLYNKTGVATTGGIAKGGTSVTLAGAPPSVAAVGRLLCIQENADYDLTFNASGDSNIGVHSHTARITGISGNTVSFTPPNLFDFPAAGNPVVKFAGACTSMCGLEDMTVTGGASPPQQGIWLLGADRFWLKNVEVTNFYGRSGIVRCDYSNQLEIRRCYIHDPTGFPNGDGYGIYLWEQSDHALVEDNIFYHTGCDIMFAHSSGHVIGYNFCWAQGRTTTTPGTIPAAILLSHFAHPFMCLIEGNYASWISNDGVHGTSSHHTIFRNSINGLHPTLTGHRWLITLAQGSYYHNIIGNVLGDGSWAFTTYEMKMDGTNYGHMDSTVWKLEWPNDGNFHMTPDIPLVNWTQSFPDPNVRGTAIIHGNYDYYHNAVHEWAYANHALPASLYHSSKPAWFGNLAWPPIGPDVTGYVTTIPAKQRWDRYVSSNRLSDLF